MEKESVKKFDLEAAFKALDEIEIPQTKGIKANRVDLKERFGHKPATEVLVEDYYDVSSNEDLEDAKEERDGEIAKAKLARIEKIVDLNAEKPEDLLPSYVGKVIMQCPQCMTLFYKNPEDIEPSEENPDIVNLNEPCQHCGNTSGYTLIGKVGAVTEDEADKYDETPAEENENELNLDFGKGTEEVDADGTGEGAEEMSDEETKEKSADETSSDKDLDLNLDEIPEEEPEEEKKEESLKESKATKQRLTVVEPGYQYKDKDGNIYTLYGDELEEDDTGIVYDWEFVDDENGDIYIREEKKEESLKESIDKDLDAKLKAHNEYIDYLKKMIEQEEKALSKADNEYVKKAIQRRIDAFKADLEDALPEDLKNEVETDLPTAEEIDLEATENVEEPKEETKESLALNESAESEIDSIIASWDVNESLIKEDKSMPLRSVEIKDKENSRKGIGWLVIYGGKENLHKEFKNEEEAKKFAKENNGELMPIRTTEVESLNEDLEDLEANATIVDYVEYKHSYCHALEPKLQKIKYYANVLKKPVNYIKAMVKNIIKDSPEVRWTDKEQWFMGKLNEFWPNSYELYKFIKNSIKKAHDTWVYVNADGELIPELNKDMISLPVKENLKEYWWEDNDPMNWSDKEPLVYSCYYNSELLGYLEYPYMGREEYPTTVKADIIKYFELPKGYDPKEISWRYIENDPLDETKPLIQIDESLTEEGNLDRLLDSDEFKTPVSKEEINAARREVAKESLKEEKEDESMAPTIYNLFLDDKLVYESKSIPLNKALSEITAYIKKLTPEQKKSFSLGWEFDESEHDGYQNVPVYDNEGNIVGSRTEWVETEGDIVVDVFSEAECKEYGYAFPEERLVVNVDYAGDAIRKAFGADITANLNESDDEESEEEVEEPEFNEDDIDELDECSLNKHIDEYLKEVYSNVKSYETTGCELKEGKLIVEGKISFNSGKEKLTMFEFLPAYCEGNLFFEGHNKDFSEDKAFTLNCSINKSKTLVTESFGYKYKINENLVEGLK